MSIFSSIGHALGNVGHDIGNFFSGGGNNVTTTTTTQALRKVTAPQQRQNYDIPGLNQPNNALNLNQLTNGSLKKAIPTVTTTTTQAQPQQNKPSLLHKLTHNPVTNFAGGVAKPFAEFGGAVVHVPQALYREAQGPWTPTQIGPVKVPFPQGKPIGDIQKTVFGTTDSGTIAKRIVGDTATLGLTAVAPGIDTAAENLGSRFISNGVLQKVVPRVVSNAGIGSAFNTIAAAEHGATKKETLKAAGEGAALGGAFGGIFAGVPLLRKAFAGKAGPNVSANVEAAADVTTPQVNEMAAGVKSANPNQAIDAAEQAAHQLPEGQPVNRPITTGTPDGAPVTPTVEVPRPTTTPAATPAVTDRPPGVEPPVPGETPPRVPTVEPAVNPPALEAPRPLEVDNTPAYQRRAATADQNAAVQAQEQATAKAAAGNLDVPPQPLDRPTFLHKQDIQATIDQGQAELDDFVNSHPTATPQEIADAQLSVKQKVVEDINKLQAARSGEPATPPTQIQAAEAVAQGEPPVAPALDVNGNPALVSDKTVAQQAEAAGVNPNPVPASVAPPELPVPPQTALTADVAPRTHDQLVKQIGDMGEVVKGQYGKRTPLNIEDLKSQAQGAVANMSDQDLLKSFSTVGTDEMVRDPQSFALARAALDRIAQNSDDPQAVQTVVNIMNALESYTSKSGQALRLVQEDFDSMPLPMKVRYIVKKIDAANAETKNYVALADDPAKADIVERTITNYLQGSEMVSNRVSQLEGQLNQIADDARAGRASTENVGQIQGRLRDERRAVAANNGELVKYYQEQLPKRSKGQRTNDFARNMMLGSFTGRINDLLTTSTNIVNQGFQNVTQGVMAKAINLVKKGAVTDTLRGGKAFVKGTAEGARQGAAEFRGTQYAGDLQKALTDNTGMRTGLTKATNPVARTIQAATEFATNVSKGVQEQRLYQLAVKEGQQEGLKGDLLAQYAEARAAVPSRQMVEAADQLHRQVNNLNENPVSRTLNRVAASIGTDKPGVAGTIGGVVRNQIMPFTSWLGGNIWNSFTDKNVVAQFTKMLASAGKGDLDGFVSHLAGTANNAAYTYALGYMLTKTGIITNKDPQGYNDSGAYLHIGGRYIPVAFTGFFAPSIILGNATYNGFNDNANDKSIGDKIADSASQSLLNLSKSVSLANAVGAENNVSRVISAVQQPGSNVTAGDVGAQLASSVGGQFIPALTGDINAVLNNGLPGVTGLDKLNPTHEASDTSPKKLNPATGNMVKDKTASAVASFENRIPGLSQTLPRKAGVAADDLVDRVTKGTRDTGASVQAAKDEQTKKDMAAYNKQNDIPDPQGTYPKGDSFENAVQARVERGEYDKAIGGLQQKLDIQKKDRNIPKSKNDDIEKQIKTLTVTKDGGYSPDMIELYKKTSLSEWRAMGDPENDAYDPVTYRQLYQYDSALAGAGVSASTKKGSENKFTAKKAKTGSGSRNGVSNTISSNKIGSTPDLGNVSFGDLAPQKITGAAAQIPTIQSILPKDLIKKRTISVRHGVG